jgi:hypothetical protein
MANVFTLVCERNAWDCDECQAVVPLADGRRQTVFQDLIDDEDGEQLMRLYSIIGDASIMDEIRLRAALGINNRLRHGAIAIMDDQLVLTDTFMVEHTDQAELEESILYLARKADDFERYIFETDTH